MGWPMDGMRGEKGEEAAAKRGVPLRLRVPANRWTIAFAAHGPTMCTNSGVDELSRD